MTALINYLCPCRFDCDSISDLKKVQLANKKSLDKFSGFRVYLSRGSPKSLTIIFVGADTVSRLISLTHMAFVAYLKKILYTSTEYN